MIPKSPDDFSPQPGLGNLAWAFARQAQVGAETIARFDGGTLLSKTSGRHQWGLGSTLWAVKRKGKLILPAISSGWCAAQDHDICEQSFVLACGVVFAACTVECMSCFEVVVSDDNELTLRQQEVVNSLRPTL
jgi:hypothetical protein